MFFLRRIRVSRRERRLAPGSNLNLTCPNLQTI
jgi:hypothetical protein